MSVLLKKKKKESRPVTAPTVTGTESRGVFFPHSLSHSRLLFLPLLSRPQSSRLYPFSITLHPQVILAPPLITRSLWNAGTRLLPATLPAHFSAHLGPVHLQFELVLSLLWALLKVRSWVMTMDKSFPLSRSLCPPLGRRQLEWMVSGPHRTEVTLPNTIPGDPRGPGLPVRREVRPSTQSRPEQLLTRLFSDLSSWSRQETFSTAFSCPFPRQTVDCFGITSISCFLTAGTKTSSDGRTKNPKYSG